MDRIRILIFFVVFSMTILQACGTKKPFIWFESVQQENVEIKPYSIQCDDRILISVWNQTQISKESTVRGDGNITVTLVGDILVAGLTTAEAAGRIAAKLESGIVQDARVTVEVLSTAPQYVSVIGEVRTPGQFELKSSDSLIDLLSRSGGLTEFADPDSIYVLRKKEPTPLVRFNYKRLTGSKSGGANFHPENGDVIIVE
jgi:polysaccharide export outer membrane protein